MKIISILIILSLCFLSAMTTKDNAKEQFKKQIEYRSFEIGDDAGQSCFEMLNGNIALIGHDSTPNGKDIFLSVIDGNKNGDLNLSHNKVQKYFGGKGDDQANAAVQDRNGDIYIVGAREKDRTFKNEKINELDCWIIKTNEWGELLWDTIMASKRNGILHDLVLLSNGDIVTVGEMDNQMLVLKISTEGQVVEKYLGNKNYSIRAITTHNQNIALTGTQKNSQGQPFKAFFMELNLSEISSVSLRPVLFAQLNIGKDIIHDRITDTYKILGDYNINAIRGSGIRVLEMNKSNNKKGQISFEWDGDNDDFASKIIQKPNGAFMIVGYSKSYPEGSTSFNPLIANFDEVKNEKGAIDFDLIRTINRNKSDYLFDVSLTSDNGILLAGATWNKSSTTGLDAWMLKLGESTKGNSFGALTVLNIGAISLLDLSRNDTLTAYSGRSDPTIPIRFAPLIPAL